MTTLVSFLGKGRDDPNMGYRTARYRFGEREVRETPYFGLALAEHLGARRLILVGTPSSMWDVLVENVIGDEADDDQRLALMEAVARGAVDLELLRGFKPTIERSIGRPMEPLVVGAAAEATEQQAILARLAEQVAARERIVIDVTHGYRHLGMLALAAARYLAKVRAVEVEAVYYGALEMTGRDGVTPVVRLDGLLHLQAWAEALAAFESSGDFSRFASLLAADGLEPELTNALPRAWQLFNLTNVHDAATALRPLCKRLRNPLDGVSELFRDRLRQALRWVEGKDLAEQQRRLALQSLRRGDFLRASLFGLEAFLSRATLDAGGDPLWHEDRDRAEAAFRQELKDGEHPDWKRAAYWLLRNVRNACAHGTAPTYEPHFELIRNPERLATTLEATLNRLTNT
jgi:CRISPR-associated Csx2 family protein